MMRIIRRLSCKSLLLCVLVSLCIANLWWNNGIRNSGRSENDIGLRRTTSSSSSNTRTDDEKKGVIDSITTKVIKKLDADGSRVIDADAFRAITQQQQQQQQQQEKNELRSGCEVAYALCDSQCVDGDDPGWSNELKSDSFSCPIYAGAGNCNTESGRKVGTVFLSYDDNEWKVVFDVSSDESDSNESKVLEQIDLYIGSEALPLRQPTDDGNIYTIIPGQYPVNLVKDDIGRDQEEHVVEYDEDLYNGKAGYFIAHAIVCENTENEDADEDDNDEEDDGEEGKDDSDEEDATNENTENPNDAETLQDAVFYAVGDTPYFSSHERALKRDMEDITTALTTSPVDAGDFYVHLGDLRYAARGVRSCRESHYEDAADILKLSPVPVFVVLGDNDWGDCPSRSTGRMYFERYFSQFESKHWDHSFNIVRQPDREDNWSFIHKKSLFIGVTLTTGWSKIMRSSEMDDQVDWVKDLIRSYDQSRNGQVGRVVIFGHASSSTFFRPISNMVEEELNNRIPILFLQGNAHSWKVRDDFYDQSSMLQIIVDGGREPALKVTVNNTGTVSDTKWAFPYDRRDRR